MKRSEIKKLIISSLDANADSGDIARQLEDEGVSFDFSERFSGTVIEKIYGSGVTINRELEFTRKLNSAFYRVALTGVAAIVILLISIFLNEGSISINSFLGLGDITDETIICLLTGN